MDALHNFWRNLGGYTQVHNILPERHYYLGDKPTRYCQKCSMNFSEVQVRHIVDNRCEFLCYPCIRGDDKLKNLPVKKIVIS